MTAAFEVDLDAAFAARDDRTRRGDRRSPARGEANVGELADPFELTHQAISPPRRHPPALRFTNGSTVSDARAG